MNTNSTLKQYASQAKSRMLKSGSFPTFVGKVPYKKYEVLIKSAENNELLIKICKLIESEDEVLNPLTYLIDKKEFVKLTPAEQQRYVFRLAETYAYVKSLYADVKMCSCG